MGITQAAGSAIIDSKMYSNTRTTKPTASSSYNGATMGRQYPGISATNSSREPEKLGKATSSYGSSTKQVPLPSQITNQRTDYSNYFASPL